MKNAHVVDTNVPIVANGKDTNASLECRLHCIDFLEALVHKGCLVVDLEGEVEAEYRRNLTQGNPGVGNRFLQLFFTQAVHRLERISLVKRDGQYEALAFSGELRRFDLSDRKFAALSKLSGAPVTVACDTDWLQSKHALESVGVRMNFLCGEDQRNWFA